MKKKQVKFIKEQLGEGKVRVSADKVRQSWGHGQISALGDE